MTANSVLMSAYSTMRSEKARRVGMVAFFRFVSFI